MDNKEFLAEFERQIEKCKKTLFSKSAQYGRNGNRLHNFFRASSMLGQRPITALRGMLAKHIIALNDIVDDIEAGKPVKQEYIDEVLGDNINYLFLAAAIFAKEPLAIESKGNR